MSAHVRARKRPPKVPAPLRLGNGSDVALEVHATEQYAVLSSGPTADRSTILTRPGARELAKWLDAYCGRALPPLIGPKGIMAEYGVSRRTVDNWRARRDFPAAVPVEGGTETVWEAEVVSEWVKAHRPVPGRPRSDH